MFVSCRCTVYRLLNGFEVCFIYEEDRNNLKYGFDNIRITLDDLDYADDIALFDDTTENATKHLSCLMESAERVGLKVSMRKQNSQHTLQTRVH